MVSITAREGHRILRRLDTAIKENRLAMVGIVNYKAIDKIGVRAHVEEVFAATSEKYNKLFDVIEQLHDARFELRGLIQQANQGAINTAIAQQRMITDRIARLQAYISQAPNLDGTVPNSVDSLANVVNNAINTPGSSYDSTVRFTVVSEAELQRLHDLVAQNQRHNEQITDTISGLNSTTKIELSAQLVSILTENRLM